MQVVTLAGNVQFPTGHILFSRCLLPSYVKESLTALVSLLLPVCQSSQRGAGSARPRLWAHGGALAQPEERAGAACLREPGLHGVSVIDASIIFSASCFKSRWNRRCPCPWQGVGLDDLYRCLPIQSILLSLSQILAEEVASTNSAPIMAGP